MTVKDNRIHCSGNDEMLKVMRKIRQGGGEVVLANDEDFTLIIVKEEIIDDEKYAKYDELHDTFGYYGNHS